MSDEWRFGQAAIAAVEGECGSEEASCVCREPKGHNGAHVCSCGGSWIGSGDDFEVVEWPAPEMSWSEILTAGVWGPLDGSEGEPKHG